MGKARLLQGSDGHEDIGAVLIANRSFLVNVATAITGFRCRSEDVVQDVFINS